MKKTKCTEEKMIGAVKQLVPAGRPGPASQERTEATPCTALSTGTSQS